MQKMSEIHVDSLIDSKELIYESGDSAIHLCNQTNSFIFTFQDKLLTFKLSDLYFLRKKIENISLDDLIHSFKSDIEIIYLPHCNEILVLDIRGVLEFREVLNETFNILALNSSIRSILRRYLLVS